MRSLNGAMDRVGGLLLFVDARIDVLQLMRGLMRLCGAQQRLLEEDIDTREVAQGRLDGACRWLEKGCNDGSEEAVAWLVRCGATTARRRPCRCFLAYDGSEEAVDALV
jgi:hypothetical protein